NTGFPDSPTKVIVALSDGKSGFYNQEATDFIGAYQLSAKWDLRNQVLAADFDGDGRADLMYIDQDGNWFLHRSVTIGSQGRHLVTFKHDRPNAATPTFRGFAARTGVQFLVGDYSGDGKADILTLDGFGLLSVLS